MFPKHSGDVRIRAGKIKDHIPLLAWPVTSVIPVAGYAEGYIVEYTLPGEHVPTEKFISLNDLNRNNLMGYFALAPPGSKKAQGLCNNLIRTIILNKAQECVPEKRIEIGPRQGWRITRGHAIFEAVNLYPKVLHPLLPRSIRNCERAIGTIDRKNCQKIYETVKCFFNGKEDLRVLYLMRVTSYHMKLAVECGIEFDLLLTVIIILAAIPVCFVLNGIGRPSRTRTIHAQDFREAQSASKAPGLIAKMVPNDATDIEFFHRPGWRGAYAYLKCSCTEEGLKAFGLPKGYDFQVDDMSKNADPANPTVATPFRMVLEHFHAEEVDRLHELKNYRAYKCIHRNGGGFAFLYLVEKQILYGWYASN